MSRENVDLVYQGNDARNRRDLGAFLALMDADVEALPRVVAIEGGHHGHEGIRRWWEHLVDFLPDTSSRPSQCATVGDLTLAAVRIRGHGAGGDTPLAEALWTPAEWRDGKCVWWANYGTEAEALPAVGLRE
jgi:hypothetical protein